MATAVLALSTLPGCSAQSASPSATASGHTDAQFIDRWSYFAGSTPTDPARVVQAFKILCANSDLALTVSAQNMAARASATELAANRFGIQWYCPDKLTAFDAGVAAASPSAG